MRDIVEEKSFEAAWDAIESDVHRRDEIMEDVTFRLSRFPESGEETFGPGIFAIPTRGWPGAPEVVVFYRYDQKKVYLLDVMLAEEEEPGF